MKQFMKACRSYPTQILAGKFFFLSLLAIALFSLPGCVADDDNTPGTANPNNPPHDNGTILEFASVTIGNQNNLSNGCFVNLDNGQIYQLQAAFTNQADIDLVFYHDTPTNSPWFSSPSDLETYTTYDINLQTDPQYGVRKWTTVNPIEISNSDISTATYDAIKTAAALTTAINEDYHAMIGAVSGVEVGTIYKFKTNMGRLGLIRIRSVNGNSNTSGGLLVDMKIVK